MKFYFFDNDCSIRKSSVSYIGLVYESERISESKDGNEFAFIVLFDADNRHAVYRSTKEEAEAERAKLLESLELE